MKYCINCRGLGQGDRFTAVDCGKHVFVDEEEESRKDSEYRAFVSSIADRLDRIGFKYVARHEVILNDTGFVFIHNEQPTYAQLDQIAAEFGTKKINFHRNWDNYHDTGGYHEMSAIEVLECQPWSEPS